MNRLIKFRICYTAQNGQKSLIYSDDKRYLITLDGKVLENYGKDWKNPFWEEVFDADEQPIIQQYTGLTDKNNKPIYEGDFIRGQFDHGPAGYREEIAPVIWTNEDGYQWNYWDLSTIEVIGNKYQWPCKKPGSFDHNGECLICDCWATDCPFFKLSK